MTLRNVVPSANLRQAEVHFMKTSFRFGFALGLAVLTTAASVSQTRVDEANARPRLRTDLQLTEIRLHDPCIVPDAKAGTYYLYTAAPARLTGDNHTGTFVYKSKDLKTWEGPFLVFSVPDGTWADPKENAWAPEVIPYKGRYYLLTTLHNSRTLLETKGPLPNVARATVIAASDSLMGPFQLLDKDRSVTPRNFMTIDGTLYVESDGTPWLVYVHEWVQKNDGTIEAIPLTDDLTSARGDPIFLLKGSDAPWLAEQAVPNAKPTIYVTDGPELYRTKTGQLLMLWSSYERNKLGGDSYVQTVARSKTGQLRGPWEQLGPLVRNDSGHGMLFRTFEGQLMLIIHQPFIDARGKLYEIEDTGDALRVAKYRDDLSGPALGPQRGQTPR